MTFPPDQPARNLALTSYDRTLLLEAGAGSGKTAILAGRVALMLASGIPAASIVAITFTEAAASELLARINRYVDRLLSSNGADAPPELAAAVGNGLTVDQLANLKGAKQSLDELTCTTIHGFCRRIVGPYPVETNSDPGAGIADPKTADLLLTDTIDEWLRDHLNEESEGFLVELVQHDAKRAVRLVRTLAKVLCDFPEVQAPMSADLRTHRTSFSNAATRFIDCIRSSSIRVPEADEIVQDLLALLSKLPEGEPKSLVAFLSIHGNTVLKKEGDFRQYRLKTKYSDAATASGVSKAQAGTLFEEAKELFDLAGVSFSDLRAEAASLLLSGAIGEVRIAVEKYQQRKRRTALQDFNDLINTARKLLATNEQVRDSLSQRYQYVLVDEFQDTDPVQSEILWRLCGEANMNNPDDWASRTIRPGALFLVGDPKQAIYRFRGADIASYTQAREAIRTTDPDAVLSITTNFRSRPGVLEYVNETFAEELSASGQPGFANLDAWRANLSTGPSIAQLTVHAPEVKKITEARKYEARAVAKLCAELIGSHLIEGDDGATRPLQPRDIALLTPSGSELYIYERALEDLGLPVSSQAGKSFWLRQEIQDMVALTRVLADGRDGLAFLALLRGPLVGITDEELLDIAWKLPPDDRLDGWPARLNVGTSLDHIDQQHETARNAIRRLQTLRRLASSTTPHHLLAQAVDYLNVRSILKQRYARPERALANIQAFLELARPFGVRGLQQFAASIESSWEEDEREVEGRADVQEDTIVILTMHAAKGLEWPIVIPINTISGTKKQDDMFVDRSEQRLYRSILSTKPTGYAEAEKREEQQAAFERARLWYVTATRARETLIIPVTPYKPQRNALTWQDIVDLDLDSLPAFETSDSPRTDSTTVEPAKNDQSREVFVQEAQRIAALATRRKWTQPSRDEGDETVEPQPTNSLSIEHELQFMEEGTEVAPPALPQGGRQRGIVMHKLIEEVLTGELQEDSGAMEARANDLITVLGHTPSDDPTSSLSPAELAQTAMRALAIPEVVELRPALEPELPVYSVHHDVHDLEQVTVGVADAIKWAPDGTAEVVVDWKSDVSPSAATMGKYVSQVRDYLESTGAKKGLIVFATVGRVLWVTNS